jgi:hypothetical protein
MVGSSRALSFLAFIALLGEIFVKGEEDDPLTH